MNDKQWKRQRRLSLLGSNEKPFSKIGKDVFEYRTYLGLTQTELGKMFNVSIRTIQKIENEPNFKPSRKTAFKIALGMQNNKIPEEIKPILKIVDNWFDKKEINHG